MTVDGLSFSNWAISGEFEPAPELVANRLLALATEVRSLRVPLKRAVKEVVIPSIKENFAVGGRPAWVPLAPSTLRSKSGGSINVRTGRLRRVAAQLNIWKFSRDLAEINDGALLSRVPYAGFVQAGTGSGHYEQSPRVARQIQELRAKGLSVYGGGMPSRPYLMIQEEDIEKIEAVFLAWLEERIGATWGSG